MVFSVADQERRSYEKTPIGIRLSAADFFVLLCCEDTAPARSGWVWQPWGQGLRYWQSVQKRGSAAGG